jgi:hypothetical protein
VTIYTISPVRCEAGKGIGAYTIHLFSPQPGFTPFESERRTKVPILLQIGSRSQLLIFEWLSDNFILSHLLDVRWAAVLPKVSILL